MTTMNWSSFETVESFIASSLVRENPYHAVTNTKHIMVALGGFTFVGVEEQSRWKLCHVLA